MIYFVTGLIILAVGVCLWLISVFCYGRICAARAKNGSSTIYYPSKKRFSGMCLCVCLLLCFVFFCAAFIVEQNSCLGLTARDAFSRYAAVCGIDSSDYKEIDGGEVSFFVAQGDGAGENWYAFKRSGLFYSRFFASPSYYYYYNEKADGTAGSLAATLAEVRTEDGYYYFVGLYDGTLLNSVKGENVVVNGSSVSLEGGVAFSSSEKISSFAIDDSQKIILG